MLKINVFKTAGVSGVKVISLLLLVYMFCTSCTDKWNKDKIEYYLSQPRYPKLTGWWKRSGNTFWYLKSTGTIALMYLLQYNGEYFVEENKFYRHTKTTNDNRKTFNHFATAGWMDRKYESSSYYMVRNDSLWLSPGLDGDINGSEMQFVGIRCDEPKEYKTARR